MGRREYGQSCSLACALDSIGERWAMLIVRELSLGPLRFSDLDRAVGGAPTDVLTKRLRDLEADGVVERHELAQPAPAVVYELTGLGRGLERPMMELARWGLGLQKVEDFAGLAPSSLANGLRVILHPPADFQLTLAVRCGGETFGLDLADGWIAASRGAPAQPDLSLSGTPLAVVGALVIGEAGEDEVEVAGDRSALARLRTMIEIPDQLRAEALELLPALSARSD